MNVDYYQMGSRNRIAFDGNVEGKRWGRHTERVNKVKGKHIGKNNDQYHKVRSVACLWGEKRRTRARTHTRRKKYIRNETKRSEMLHTQNKNGSKGRHQQYYLIPFENDLGWMVHWKSSRMEGGKWMCVCVYPLHKKGSKRNVCVSISNAYS